MTRMTRPIAAAACVLCALLAACASSQTNRRAESKQAGQYYRLAQVDFAQGKNQNAIAHLKKSLSLDPRNANVHNYLGVVYLLLSDYQHAERELEEALKLNPYLTDARNSLGAVYMKTGRAERARAAFDEALRDKTYPSPEKILYNIGTLQLEEKHPSEALETFRRAVAANPAYAKGYFGLGLALSQAGRREDAVENFRKVISLEPKSPEAARARELLGQKPADRKG